MINKLLSFRKLEDQCGRIHNYLRISLTEGCNLRCHYCMPHGWSSKFKQNDWMTIDEICFLTRYFVQRGVQKVRLTGGEPTLRRDLEDIIYSLNTLRQKIAPSLHLAMTTNGVVFKHKAVKLKKAGLDSVNFSLDSLRPERLIKITGCNVYKPVLASLFTALEHKFNPVKLNCVVMRGTNDDELCDFVELTRNMPIEVRFIEYMPFGGNRWDHSLMVPYFEMLNQMKEKYPNIKQLKGYPCGTAKMYQVPDFLGTFGFISSMSANFCATCTRLRVTADGSLKTCLHGTDEVNIIQPLRAAASLINLEQFTGEEADSTRHSIELLRLIEKLNYCVDSALSRKAPQHAGMNQLALLENRSMLRIGG